jgi:hypothetical protein
VVFHPDQCEHEGCIQPPVFIVINFARGWIWVACTEHEATKLANEASVLLPQPPAL